MPATRWTMWWPERSPWPEAARHNGANELFVDPEIDASPAYAEGMRAAGFEVTEEAQPSIHVMRLTLPADADEAHLFGSIAKSTRQRVHGAERAGIGVRIDASAECLSAFASLLAIRSDDLGLRLRPEFGSLPFTAA